MSSTETACYLTADLFYVEVLLHSSGEVLDLKVAQHGEAPEVINMELSQVFTHSMNILLKINLLFAF